MVLSLEEPGSALSRQLSFLKGSAVHASGRVYETKQQ
jgi:hypothetical protein